MKKTPLQRKTPLSSHSNLKRSRIQPKKSSKTKAREFSNQVRNMVRERSQGVCELCHAEPAVHFHHCIFRSQLGTGDITNCLHLGIACHNLAHSKREIRERCVKLAIELSKVV